jgi:hypothetical protein
LKGPSKDTIIIITFMLCFLSFYRCGRAFLMKFYGLPTLITDEKVDEHKGLLRKLNGNNFLQLLETNLSFADSLHRADGVMYRPGRMAAAPAPNNSKIIDQLHSPLSGTGHTLSGVAPTISADPAAPEEPEFVLCNGKWCGADDGLVEVVVSDGGGYRAHWNVSNKRSATNHTEAEVSGSVKLRVQIASAGKGKAPASASGRCSVNM